MALTKIVENALKTPTSVSKAHVNLEGLSFQEILKSEIFDSTKDSINKAENLMVQSAQDNRVNKLELVNLITSAEIELQKFTTILSKAHDAYDKIFHLQL